MEENVQMAPWLRELKQERADLLDKTLKLKIFMEDSDTKLNSMEWDMLRRQYGAMREYLQALTDRCVYHGLLESANLYLEYPSYNAARCGR